MNDIPDLPDLSTSGKRLKFLMDQREVTPGELAALLGQERPTQVYEWLNDTQKIGLRSAKRLAKALHGNMGWLSDNEGPAPDRRPLREFAKDGRDSTRDVSRETTMPPAAGVAATAKLGSETFTAYVTRIGILYRTRAGHGARREELESLRGLIRWGVQQIVPHASVGEVESVTEIICGDDEGPMQAQQNGQAGRAGQV